MVKENNIIKTSMWVRISHDRYYKLEKNIKIGYLDQIPNYADNEKVYTCLKSVFGELNIISEQLKLLEEK